MPWLSWQAVQRTRKGLLYERGMQFQSDPTFLAGEKPGVGAQDSCL
jgi:hypothetical protein